MSTLPRRAAPSVDKHPLQKKAASNSRSRSRDRQDSDEGSDLDDGRAWRAVTGVLSNKSSLNNLRSPGDKTSRPSGSFLDRPQLSAEPESYESDGEHEDLLNERREAKTSSGQSWRQRISRRLELSTVQKRVLKCSIAYFLASLFTFVDPLSDLVSATFEMEGPVANAHFVATIATGKTSGQMIEADLFLVWAALFSFLVCTLSMATAVSLNIEDVEWLSHIVVVVIWLSGSMAIIAYCKNRVGKATFGSACSMTALINSVIICKEGAVHLKIFEFDAIWQMAFIVFIGAAISNLVCFLLWAESSTSKLQDNVSKTLSAFAELITLLSRTFLLDEDAPLRDDRILKSAVETHQKSFTALKDSLDAAKLELLDPRISGSHEAYDDIVASMTRLAQHTSGLRSGCSLQNRLQQARREGELVWPPPEENVGVVGESANDTVDIRLQDSARTFASFQKHVGPSLRRLTSECKDAFLELRTTFLGTRREEQHLSADLESGSSTAVLEKIKMDLISALSTFERDHNRALKRLYKHHPSRRLPAAEEQAILDDSIKPALDLSKANEDVFELFFFLFNLEELVHELIHLVDAFVVVRAREDQLESLKHSRGQRYGRLAGVAASFGAGGGPSPISDTFRHKVAVLAARFATLLPFGKRASPFPLVVDIKSHWSQRQALPFLQRQQRKLWQWLQRQKHPDMLFSIKVGVGAGMLGAPAFFEATRETWVLYRGEWAMISYMVVVATTVGQTNWNLFFRILGTILGALVAIVAYHALYALPVLLAIWGFLFSLPCFYLVIVHPKYATTGRFILLAYNLTALYAYNMREADLRITYVAFRRSVAVAVGSIWAWAVTTLVWRYEARKELRAGLSELLLSCAWLYEKLVQAYSTPPKELARTYSGKRLNGGMGERDTLLSPSAQRRLSSTIDEFVELELYLQRQLIHLRSLLGSAQLEWRLRGPFPAGIYRDQIASAQAILDQLHAMRCVTTRPAWYTTVRREFIIPVQTERRAMVGSVILYFAILASSISLKAPLPPYMPPAEDARRRLMDAIRELPVVKRRVVHRADSLLYFAYAAVMEDVIRELETLGASTRELFGILGNRIEDDFEELFRWEDQEAENASVASSSSDD